MGETDELTGTKDLLEEAAPAPRRRPSRILWFLFGAIPAAALAPYVWSRATAEANAVRTVTVSTWGEPGAARFAGTLRVGAFNIAHGRGAAAGNWDGGTLDERRARLEAIAALLRERKLDVVVLNEVDFEAAWSGHQNQASFLAREGAFPHRAEQRNLDVALPLFRLRFGNAVLSRYPIKRARLVSLPGYSSAETFFAGKKRALLCEIELDARTTVAVLAVHLEPRSRDVRVRSARAIERVREQSRLPLVVAGDFNSTLPGYPGGPDAKAKGKSALQILTGAQAYQYRPRKAPDAAGLSFPSTKPKTLIDWILIPSAWSFRSYEIADVTLSDHRPVIAEVAVPEPPRGPDAGK